VTAYVTFVTPAGEVAPKQQGFNNLRLHSTFRHGAALYALRRTVPQRETAMLMVMDMSTGKLIEDEFGAFEDEVLNAEWTPASPELQLGLQEVQHRATAQREVDAEAADAFLAAMYRNQQ
jgi:hypothetical protein